MTQNFKRWSGTAAVVAVVLSAYAVWAYAQERHDLPPFDHAKASTLSAEKRAEYERLLFNEIVDWNGGTPRHDLWSREAEWLRMATDGYELAYITLQVLSPTKGRFSLDKPLQRLTELAEGGDAGAMCLYFSLLAVGSQNKEYETYKPRTLHYMKRGVEHMHPECLVLVGARMLRGLDGFEQDKQLGFRMLVDAERAGFNGAAQLWGYFRRKGLEQASDVVRQRCWELVFQQYTLAGKPEYLVDELKAYAVEHKRPDLNSLADELIVKSFGLEDCVALGLGE